VLQINMAQKDRIKEPVYGSQNSWTMLFKAVKRATKLFKRHQAAFYDKEDENTESDKDEKEEVKNHQQQRAAAQKAKKQVP